MKVLDRRCANGHGFEGWFASEDDFQSQASGGLVACPMCGDHLVTKLPSAPRLNLSGAREPAVRPSVPDGPAPAQAVAHAPPDALKELHDLWQRAVAHVLESTEDVGDRFAEEARRIHYGESEQRGIRGQASREEREALADEGIEVMSMPLPTMPKGPLQ